MNDVLSKYIGVAIDIILFSLIVAIIAVFSNISRDALNTKVENNVIMGELTEYRAAYKYIELAQSNSLVIGDDIVKFITEFYRQYDVEIKVGMKSPILLDKRLSSNEDWSISNILGYLGNTLTDEYIIQMVYGNDRDLIDKFIFQQK